MFCYLYIIIVIYFGIRLRLVFKEINQQVRIALRLFFLNMEYFGRPFKIPYSKIDILSIIYLIELPLAGFMREKRVQQ